MACSELRDIGFYQWTVMLAYGCCSCLVGMSNVGILLIAPKLDHWCADPSPNFQNLSHHDQRRIMSVNGDVCRRPDVNFSSYSVDELLEFANTSSGPNATRSCDAGLVFENVYFDYTATEQYGLGCERRWFISLASTMYLLGYFVAALTSGTLADLYGRKTVLVVSLLLCGVWHMVAAFAPWLALFLLSRFMVGMFDIATYTSGLVLVTELVRTTERKYGRFLSALFYSAGGVVIAVVNYSVRTHTYLQMFMSLAYIPLIFATWFWVAESPRWLASQKRNDQAYAVVELIAKYNGQSLRQLEHLHIITETKPIKKKTAKPIRRANWADLFRTRTIRKRTIVMALLWCSLVLVYYALMYSLGDFGVDVRLNMIVSGTLEFPSVLLAVLTIDKFGRQKTMFVFRMLSGVSCLCMTPFMTNKQSPFLLMFATVGKFFAACEFFIIYIYTQELYPTVIRNMGVGICSTISRVAGMVAPQIAMLNIIWAPLPVVLLGSVAICGGMLVPMLPETTRCELPQTIADGENFHPNHTYHITCSLKRDISENGIKVAKTDEDPKTGNVQESAVPLAEKEETDSL